MSTRHKVLSKKLKLSEAKVVKQIGRNKLAPQVGLEPTTKRLTANSLSFCGVII
jgi:hypothetical protein